MPRPTTKDALLTAAATGFHTLSAFIDDLPAEYREAEFGFQDRDRCVRDVVFHLFGWHQMMLTWYAEGMAAERPAIPAPGYTWRTTPQLNQALWEQAQAVSLTQALADLTASHARVCALITAHTDDELFTKQRYRWTGSTSLGAYLISATSSHYDWALTKLRKARRTW